MMGSKGGDQTRKPLFYLLIHTVDRDWQFGIYGNHLVDMLEDHGIEIISGDLAAGDPTLVNALVTPDSSEQFLMLLVDDQQVFGFDR